MDQVIAPILLYVCLALGGVGVCLALPRKGLSPQVIGAVLAAGAIGVIILAMGIRAFATDAMPNVYFYVFSLIALGASLRVISHPRPVYAALYFILTILASAGLYLILAAEFMAFALIIVYAGAILITYLFVIMLATQAPTEEEIGVLSEYDLTSREPALATLAGFVLLAVLTTMLFRGSMELQPAGTGRGDALLAQLPGRIEAELRTAGLMEPGESLAREADGSLKIDMAHREVWLTANGVDSWPVHLPDSLSAANVELVGFNLLQDHPGSIEIAGVILLMAMLGAVVLARRKVQAEEEEKLAQAQAFSAGGEA